MDPKFQSSFIPKSPNTGTIANTSTSPIRHKEKSIITFLAAVVFIISLIAAVGMFGYKYFLKYRIDKMGSDLEEARAVLEPETIDKLTRLNDRLASTRTLVSAHTVPTLLFEFLEESTPKTVRFNHFDYSMSPAGLKLEMKGEARGYTALALQADIFSKSGYFKNPVFSNLVLNQKGDVTFSFEAMLDPGLVSYNALIERTASPLEDMPMNSSSTEPLESEGQEIE